MARIDFIIILAGKFQAGFIARLKLVVKELMGAELN